MRSRRLASLLLPVAIGLLSSGAWAADAAEAVPAPSTAEDSAPAASPAPATADMPRPISLPPPPPEAPKERTANNGIYVEGLGAGFVYSLNYEHMFGDFAPRIGFGYLSLSATTTLADGTVSESGHASVMTIPLSVSYLGIGSLKHMFEVGAGATILFVGEGVNLINIDSRTGSGSATMAFATVTTGYRFQPPDGGFLFRAGMNLIMGGSDPPVLPWPYVALGGAF